MLVALYKNHHELPWSGGSTNPFDVFCPEHHQAIPFKGKVKLKKVKSEEVFDGYETICLEEEKRLYSFLLGLHNVKANYLMAHVSALSDHDMKEYGYWNYPKRVLVQISTRTEEYSETGFPVVYNLIGERKPDVRHVWGGDNVTSFPDQFFHSEKLAEMAANNPAIWTRFFVEQLDLDPKLKEVKDKFRAAKAHLEKAKKAVSEVQIFSPDKLNLNLTQRFNTVSTVIEKE